jgi:hypothetical protein
MSTGKRFGVRGVDQHGDVHIFRTDEQELAHEMVGTMKEDRDDVTLTEHDALPGTSYT